VVVFNPGTGPFSPASAALAQSKAKQTARQGMGVLSDSGGSF
jgi:hypothetical protein